MLMQLEQIWWYITSNDEWRKSFSESSILDTAEYIKYNSYIIKNGGPKFLQGNILWSSGRSDVLDVISVMHLNSSVTQLRQNCQARHSLK